MPNKFGKSLGFIVQECFYSMPGKQSQRNKSNSNHSYKQRVCRQQDLHQKLLVKYRNLCSEWREAVNLQLQINNVIFQLFICAFWLFHWGSELNSYTTVLCWQIDNHNK